MTTSRVALIPWYHLTAELAAYPLASELALRSALTSLNPESVGITGPLWRAAERDLLQGSPSFSLDELLALRDKIWFGGTRGGREARSLGNYLRNVTSSILRAYGATAAPELKADEGERSFEAQDARARAAWRWISFALPPDLLFSALGDQDGCPVQTDTVSPMLARRLRDDGFAELHLHLGAGLDFPVLWTSTLRAIADVSLRSDAFQSPGACLDEGRELGAWLLRAAIVRYILAVYLASSSEYNNFEQFERQYRSRFVQLLGATGTAVLASAVRDLMQGRLSSAPVEHHATLQLLYSQLTSIRTACPPDRLSDVWKIDTIAPLASVSGMKPETWFIWQGLRHSEHKPKDSTFAVLFWQVIRIRCMFYRHVVQRPMTPGLHWFVRFYSRLSPARRPLGTRVQVESAWRLNGIEHGLRAMEVRTSPDRAVSGIFALIKDSIRAFDSSSSALRHAQRSTVDMLSSGLPPSNVSGFSDSVRKEFGFVLHFARDRGGGASKGLPAAFWRWSNADPTTHHEKPKLGNPTGYRYARFYLERREQAYALGRLIAAFPLTLEHIRGLDLCTDEVGVPTWVMAPLLRHVRDAGEKSSLLLQHRHGLSVPPLRTAVHAGEDFVHLLSGLRRLDEAIDRLHLRSGDRLGHGLALGVEPKAWATRAGRIAMPAEERMFDLVWEWSWRSRHGGSLSNSRHLVLEREIAECSERIFDKAKSPQALERLMHDLHDEARLRWAGFPSGPVPQLPKDPPERLELLLRYLVDPSVFERGREIVYVDSTGEGAALEELQRGLRRKVGARCITVEVNPSSNLLIAQLAHLGEHPLWRLRPFRATDDVPPLTVAIGSDDPLTFATNLRQEYQLVYDALLLEGCSAEQAEAWIEGVRKASLNARFTVPRTGRAITEIVNAQGFQLHLLP